MKINYLTYRNRGYTLLFAVLVAALVLAIGISILTISKREFLLATSARDSTSAIYAADGAIECAAYVDIKFDAFNLDGSKLNLLGNCGIPTTMTNTVTQPYVFHVALGSNPASGGPCAVVTVTKTDKGNGIIATDIDARGYNIGWNPSTGLCEIGSVKRVERAMHYAY